MARHDIDLVIFDCDGVLIDSEVLSAEVLIEEVATLGIAMDRAYVRQHFLGRSFPTVAKTIRESFDCALPADFEQRYRSRLLERFETELRPTPGVRDMLDRLDRACCVATSSSPQRATRSLAIAGLDAHFGPRLFTASQVANGKPAPDLFLFAARSMGVAPDRVLVIEDSLPGVAAAEAAGMRVLLYLGAGHMAGTASDAGGRVASFDDWADFPAMLDFMTETPQP